MYLPYSLDEFKTKRSDYQTDLAKFKDVFNQLKDHCDALQNIVNQRNNQLTEANEESERLQKVVEQLKETIATQPMSVDDLHKLQVEHKGILEASERTQRFLKEKKEILRVAETEWAKKLTDLDLTVRDYNAKLDDLALVTNKSASDWKDYKAEVQHEKAQDENIDSLTLLGVDVVEAVPARIQKEADSLSNEATIKSQQLQEALDEYNNLHSAIDAIASNLAGLQQEAEKKRLQQSQRQEEYLAKQNELKREIYDYEQKAMSRNTATVDGEYEAYCRQCTELEQLLVRTRLECKAAVEALHDQISKCIVLIKEHDMFCQQVVQQVHAYWEKHKGDLPALKAP